MEEGNTTNAHENTERVTWEGCSVLLDINGGDRLVFARLTPAATMKIGNNHLPLSPLVGCPFGSLFEMETGPEGPFLARVQSTVSSDSQHGNDMRTGGNEMNVKIKDAKDNRALIDDNSAQTLSSEDILEMQREGVAGDKIIEALISNSSTFEKKTAFSQEKYMRKKQKKYAPKVLLRRPFTRSICEAYFKKNPLKIGYLRLDTLSLLLSAANVNGFSDVLVVDKTGGMVAGAVAERLGSVGNVCCTYLGSKPYPLDIVKIFNFGPDLCSRVLQSPFDILSSAQVEDTGILQSPLNSVPSEIPITNAEMIKSCVCPQPIGVVVKTSLCNTRSCGIYPHGHQNIYHLQKKIKSCVSSGQSIPLSKEQSHLEEASDDCIGMDLTCNDKVSEKPKIRKSVKHGQQASREMVKLWKEKGFTSLIVAAPDLDIESLVEDLLPLLAYSAPFAIYHQYLQPLATCMQKLQTSKLAIGLQISEPFTREYQVLPSRTHPHMQTSGFGGYMLSGTRISYGESIHANILET